jgi:MFS family permease
MSRRRAVASFAGIFVATLLSLTAVGAVLPVLPRYVRGPLGDGDVAVGVVIGCYALTGLGGRPFAGRLADSRGRRPLVVAGALLAALAGLLYLAASSVAGLVGARLVLGLGEGMVFTAGSAWVVDLAPVARRARVIGLYGLAIWTGLTIGPAVGELLFRAFGYDVVWAFAAASPFLGALIALRIPDAYEGRAEGATGPLLARESVRPGLALALASIGYATVAAFIVLYLESNGERHGAIAFTVFAATVVLTRLVAGGLPDRVGPLRCAAGAAVTEAIGLALIAIATALPAALCGAVAMGAAFSLLYPSLSLVVVNQVTESRRGAALGTFTAFFDLGVGVGAPLAGIAASLGGYAAAFWLAAACATGTGLIVTLTLRGAAGRAGRRALLAERAP